MLIYALSLWFLDHGKVKEFLWEVARILGYGSSGDSGEGTLIRAYLSLIQKCFNCANDTALDLPADNQARSLNRLACRKLA